MRELLLPEAAEDGYREQGFSEADTLEYRQLAKFPSTQVEEWDWKGNDSWGSGYGVAWSAWNDDQWGWGSWGWSSTPGWWSKHQDDDRCKEAESPGPQSTQQTPQKQTESQPRSGSTTRSPKSIENAHALKRATTMSSQPATPATSPLKASPSVPATQPSPTTSPATTGQNKRKHGDTSLKKPEKDVSTGSPQEQWASIQDILQRGHTVDRLSDDELAEVVFQIDRLKKSRSMPVQETEAPTQQGQEAQKEKDESQATEADKKKKESQATEADKEKMESQATEAQKEKKESEATEADKEKKESQATAAQKDKKESQATEAQKDKKESQATEAQKDKKESQATEAQKDKKESQATEAQKDKKESQATVEKAGATKAEEQKDGDPKDKQELTPEQEAKLALKKKLHARYMRFSRSLTSGRTPKEVRKLADRDLDSDQRNFLFEHWLQANENWNASKLLVTLKNKSGKKKVGLRKWLTKADLLQKYKDEEVVQAIIDAKVNDKELCKTQVRNHPDCPHREDLKQYLCVVDDSEENYEGEEVEHTFEMDNDLDESSSDQSSDEDGQEEDEEEQAKQPTGGDDGEDKPLNAKEMKGKARKAVDKATDKLQAVRKCQDVESGDKLLKAMKDDVEAQASLIRTERADLQRLMDESVASMPSAVDKLTTTCDKFDKITKEFWNKVNGEDVDKDTDGLLQHMYNKISSGASSIDAAMKDAQAGFQDTQKFFKGKTIKSLMRFKPGNAARDFFKTVKLPLEPTPVKVPVWEYADGEWKQASTTVPVLDIHEILSYVHCELGLQTPPEKVKEYWAHLCSHGVPFATRHPSTHANEPCRHSHIPFSLYGDECQLSADGSEKVTAMFVSLTLFRPKEVRLGHFMVFCMKDEFMVHENLATLSPILKHIAWSSNVAFDGKFPQCGPMGEALSSSKMARAGDFLAHGRAFAACELRGDWKWHERTLRLLHTPTSTCCCLFCGAEASDESPLRYYETGESAGWASTIATTADFLLHKVRPGCLSDLDCMSKSCYQPTISILF
ncbi:unnamed protein product [Symbiodinium sp. CCMP2592]|nr:unnamed protein product [Symbiodinium sp. CCMP2592]